MRVLQVGSSLKDWGGIERYIVYLSQGLADRGHDVTIAAPSGSPLATRSPVRVLPLEVKAQFHPAAFTDYLRLFAKERFDIVHVHFGPDFVLPPLAARSRAQKGVILTRHVALHWKLGKAKRYGRLFEHIIPVSDAVRQKLLESGIPESQMSVAKAGTPGLVAHKDALEIRNELGAGSDDFLIGCFGRLVAEKGVDTLIRAAKGGGLRFEIYGEGPIRSELEALVAQEGVGDWVQFRGFTPDVADAMNAMDAIVLPSVWEEAFPYAALEAMSLGKPVLASRVGGLPEIVEEGKTGLLFGRGDGDDLRAKAFELKNDSGLCEQMKLRAKELHQSEYTIEKMAERIEKVYERLL